MKQTNPIADLYELSPMQQGMLFHSLYAPTSGLYTEQRTCQLQGYLAVAAFKQAWQQVVDRHPILRTGFYWKEVEKPLQVVFETAELEWIEQDWQHLTESEQALALAKFLQSDRIQGFELTQAPLMRCALLQIAKDTYHFVWTHHHLLMDGWCNAILLKEVLAFYEAACQKKTLLLPPPRPFRDYILWLQRQDLAQAEQFWRKDLKGLQSPTTLLFKTSQNTQEYQEQLLRIDSIFTAQIHLFCQQHRITLNTLIQAAWSLLLSCHSESTDLIFGVTVSGRPPTLAGVETMMGLFINTLPVRVQLPADTELLSWIQAFQSQQLEREQYAYSSLIDIQSWSDIPRGTPLFESLIVFENYPVSIAAALQGKQSALQISQSRGYAHTNYPLTLSVIPGSELLLQIGYHSGFTKDIVTRFLEHLHIILQSVLSNPHQLLSQISLLTVAEQQQLAAWNQTDRPFSSLCVHQQFEVQAEKTPAAIALIYDDQHITYRQLNASANHLAHYLVAQGIQPNTLIAVCLDRSPALIISLLAILKAGAAYLPLDPAYPSDRLAFMLENAQAKVLITTSVLSSSLPHISKILFDIQQSVINQEKSYNLDCSISAEHLAYVIYTSGSTGKPKGVMISHRSLSNYAAAAAEKFALTESDRVLQFASISFDAAAEEIYPTLMTGAALILRSAEMIRTTATFFTTCQQQQLTLLDLPTAYWQQLVQQMVASLPLPASLRLLIIGGESASANDLATWLKYSQNRIRLINTYGPTETTIVATWWEATEATTVSIGEPIPNVHIYVLNKKLQQVPIGVPGELYIGGLGVALGYLQQDQLTTTKFLLDPFRAGFQRIYKTGDRVRHQPDGNLEFLGRYDQQIKLRGFRLELGEIESALKQYPDIQEAIVTLQGDPPRLVAYLLSSSPLSTSDLRAYLQTQLPSYMLPAVYVPLEQFPLTPSGKLDRKALSQIELAPEAAPATVSRTPTEELLTGIWKEVLGVEPGVHDNFFELGGHSLLATRVISQIRQVFGVEVALRQIFEQPILVEFAKELNAAIASSTTPIAPITPVPRTGTLPLSFAQQRQWFLSQLEPDSPLYNIPAAIRILGDLNTQALQQSLNTILQRHETLHTAFITVDGQPTQRILPTLDLDLPVLNLSALSTSEQQKQVKKQIDQQAKQAIAIDHPPLLRATLLRLNDQEHIILLTLHHIVADGWSLGILIQELSALYLSFITQTSPALPPLSIQYVDFAVWQRSQQHFLDTQLTYWKQQLKDLPTLELPTDRPRPAVRSLQGASLNFSLPFPLTIALKQLSQESGCTLFMTLLAAFQTILHRYTGSEDLVVGTAIANRNRAEIEGLIGFFINTLAIRSDLSGNPTFVELLHRVRAVTLAAYAHQDLPFEQLVEALQPQRSLSYTPLFQVMFVLQNVPFAALEIENLQWTPISSHSGTAKFDLTLSMQESDEGLIGTLEYSLDLFEPSTIQRLAGHLQTLLEAIATNSEQRISELPLLTAIEQQQLSAWNQTQAPYPNRCIHEQFEAQVEQTPHAIALVYQDQQISYAELNQKANQLAHYLRSLGVGLEAPVAICLDRTPDFIISILAILKADGTYIPLEPIYPPERLRFILTDTQAKVLIASECHSFPLHQIHPQSYPQNYPDSNPISITKPAHLAYILYTSGSTGVPKGVCTPHRGVVRLVRNTNYVNLDQTEVILQAAPLTFDAATFEIWGALLNGGRLVLLPQSQPSLIDVAEAIAHHKITTLWLTAGLFSLMVSEHLARLKPLRQLLAGGDVLSVSHIQTVRRTHPHIRLINGYGPTEGTTFSCYHTVSSDEASDISLPIGKSISNTQIYVLDTYLQPVPVGVPGELYITGDGLARGYVNRPDLTAEKFVPGWENVLYKTGDRVRYRSDGSLEYLGRLDQQVKIRGFRIEPGEIEAILVQHPAIQAAVVMPQSDLPGNKRLVAYIVVEEEQDWTQELRQFLSVQLPEYMIPAFFMPLRALPLTKNGKVDRQALPAVNSTPCDRPLISPRTSVEATLVEIWSAVLYLPTVSIEDNFFELGGDSILAIQIVSRAQQAGLQFTPKQLFQHQTIAELALVAIANQPISAEQGLVTGLVPLTPIQHWFFEQSLPNPHHFNQAVFLSISPGLNPDWLEQIFHALQHHHDMLRLQVQMNNCQLEITSQTSNLVTYFNYTDLPEEQQQATLEQIATELQMSLDLSTGTVMRVALFNLGDRQPSRLLFVLHHLLIDGISWRILLEDFQTAYQQINHGQAIQLPPKTTSFKQWAEQLQDYTVSSLELDYWRSLVQESVQSLPIDFPINGIAQSMNLTFSTEQTQTLLTETPKAYNTQINEILLTALILTLKQWSGNPMFIIDLEGHGREKLFDNVDISRTVGWFTSLYPVEFTISGKDLGESLKQVKETIRRIPNRGIGYGLCRYVMNDGKIQSELKALPRAEISFNYLGQFLGGQFLERGEMQLAPESIGLTQAPDNPRPYLFEITASIVEGQLRLSWSYSQHSSKTIAHLLETFQTYLLHLIEHCQSSDAGGYTPSDFALAELDQSQLDAVLASVTFGSA